MEKATKFLLTGATGYLGTKLIPHLILKGEIIAPVRSFPEVCFPNVFYLYHDFSKDDPAFLMKGIDVAFYFLHSMDHNKNFSIEEEEIAKKFALAAEEAKIRRIIYVGALYQNTASQHLLSRHRVGDVLRKYAPSVEIIELRCSIVIGAGSLGYEVVSSLTEKLPIMVCPRWLKTPLEPVAEKDLLDLLVFLTAKNKKFPEIIEVGCGEIISYRELIEMYAKIKKLKRFFIPLYILTPRLSSLWLSLVTPYRFQTVRYLVESALHATVTKKNDLESLLKRKPISPFKAIKEAIKEESVLLEEILEGRIRFTLAPYLFMDERKWKINTSVQKVTDSLKKIGKSISWPYLFLWKVRGWVDSLFGGVGMRLSIEAPFKEGEKLNFWKIVKITKQLILLEAEMKLPGKAWLRFSIAPDKENSCVLTQRAIFHPKNILGVLYWIFLWPVHVFIFKAIGQKIKEEAEKCG